jgi:hypothetical protein
MLKKTIMGVGIATILLAYISALTLSNQAFAQPDGSIGLGQHQYSLGFSKSSNKW